MATTPNLGLNLPAFDVTTWHDEVNNNFSTLDALLYTYFIGQTIEGVWLHSTAYTVNDKVVDSANGLVYKCEVNHTSAATGTFEDDRVANPTYWAQVVGIGSDASLVAVTPTGSLVDTNVQDALETIVGDIDTLEAQTGFRFKPSTGIGITTTTTVNLSDAGNWFNVAANVTVTLPALASATNGLYCYTFIASTAFTLSGNGSDTINNAGYVANTMALLKGDTITVVSNGNSWYAIATGFRSKSFEISAGANGYAKQPNGFIEQWGVSSTNPVAGQPNAVSFPVTFSACYGVFLQLANSGDPAGLTLSTSVPTTTGFNVYHSTSVIRSFYWRAIGTYTVV